MEKISCLGCPEIKNLTTRLIIALEQVDKLKKQIKEKNKYIKSIDILKRK